MKISAVHQTNFRNLFEKEIADGKMPGGSVSLWKDGEEIFHGEYGYADIENRIPIRKDTIFKIYSMTKPITAVAVMILFERGLLSLKDPVSLYLPGFRNQKVLANSQLVPLNREVTIWDLLNMTSGLTYPDVDEVGIRMNEVFEGAAAAQESGYSWNTLEFVNRMGAVPLAFQPGERWRYGINADVLGAIVEVISGKSFGDFLREELFIPLHMEDTDFYVPEEKRHRLAKCYEMDWIKGTATPYQGKNLMILDFTQVPTFQSGGAGLASTLSDYGKFAHMLLSGGTVDGKRFLNDRTIRFMTGNQLSPAQLKCLEWDSLQGYGYSCLMRVLLDAGAGGFNGNLGEYGWDGWMGTYVSIDPVENMVMLFGTQRLGIVDGRFARILKTLAYSAL
jgi:CubicO group peptidase (beta-lactamase class C family)